MMYARLVRPPSHGATVQELDTSGVADVDGAMVVRDGDLVAVLHATPDGAEQALERVTATWSEPELVRSRCTRGTWP